MPDISVREAVIFSGLTRQQVYNLIVNGRILARKNGTAYRIDKRSLVSYLHRRRAGCKQQPAQPAA